jgi:hypothetical protein
MLLNSGYRIIYNIVLLQKHEQNNTICGRFVGLRLQFKDLDGNKFAELIT